ncbi:MAG TPA: tetratricopeptide repeat protein [Thermoflexia bacterium]|nr:tetratricopeptide repeat protein [Thermoflexia bacterium]
MKTIFRGPLVLLSIAGLIGALVTYNPTLGWPALLALLGSVVLFFIAAHGAIPPRRTGTALLLLAALLAVGSFLPQAPFDAGDGFLEAMVPLGLLLTGSGRGWRRWAWGAAMALVVVGLAGSGSLGSWVGLVVAAVVAALLRLRRRPLRWALIGTGATGLALMASLHPVQQVAIDRLHLFRNSLYLLTDYPLTGVGLGDTFALAYSRYQLLIPVSFLTTPHNLLLAVGLGMGVIGLAAVVWLLATFYRFVVRVERSGPSPALFRAAWLGTTAALAHGLIDSPPFPLGLWLAAMGFGLMGIAVATGRVSERRQTRPWRWGLVAVVVLLVTGLLLLRQPLLGMGYANAGALWQARADLAPHLERSAREAATGRAVACFERALAWDPLQPTANRRLGLMALEREDFDAAVAYLERAYQRQPGNPATWKGLGYAYLWTGWLDPAEELLSRLDDRAELVEELGVWRGWWGRQGREDLAGYAGEMVRRLGERTSE